MDKGFPKGGGGGGFDVWEKFPNNIVFFFESVPKALVLNDGEGDGLTMNGLRYSFEIYGEHDEAMKIHLTGLSSVASLPSPPCYLFHNLSS